MSNSASQRPSELALASYGSPLRKPVIGWLLAALMAWNSLGNFLMPRRSTALGPLSHLMPMSRPRSRETSRRSADPRLSRPSNLAALLLPANGMARF